MRRLQLALALLLICSSCTSTHLSRKIAQREVAHVGTATLDPEAVEIRSITPQGTDRAVVETTVALAFQLERAKPTDEWRVDAVRLGASDWVDMTELLTALNGGTPPLPPPSRPAPVVSTPPTDVFHANPTDFAAARRALLEVGMSSQVPDAIEVRRIASQSDKQTIVEATVSFGFQFKRDPASKRWRIEAARLGQRDWIVVDDLLAALNEGRRRDTAAKLSKLTAGINAFRRQNGTLPAAPDIVKLTDILHPSYMNELIRLDGWNQPILYQVTGSTFRLVSSGPDHRPGTPDDLIVVGGPLASP
jgi:Bacterial type II secretion system protein G.